MKSMARCAAIHVQLTWINDLCPPGLALARLLAGDEEGRQMIQSLAHADLVRATVA